MARFEATVDIDRPVAEVFGRGGGLLIMGPSGRRRRTVRRHRAA
ncbi:hypothetical protein RKD45_006512 [Streptomyces griseus]